MKYRLRFLGLLALLFVIGCKEVPAEKPAERAHGHWRVELYYGGDNRAPTIWETDGTRQGGGWVFFTDYHTGKRMELSGTIIITEME